jgi:hypothetical protein
MQERAFALMKRRPVLSCYRLTSSQKSLLYDSSRLAGRLGWKAKVSLVEAMDRLVQSEASRRDGAEAVARASTSGVVPPIAGSHRPAETDSAG